MELYDIPLTITCDLGKNTASPQVISINQNEANIKKLRVEFVSGGKPWEIPTGFSCNILMKKADGFAVDNPAESISGNAAVFNITPQMSVAVGENRFQIQIIKNEDDVRGFVAVLSVQRAALSNDEIISDSELETVEEIIREQVDTWLDEHPDATTTVLDNSLTLEKFTEETRRQIVNVPASTSAPGVVQLNDTLTSSDTTQAATANAVRAVNEKVETVKSDLSDAKEAIAVNSARIDTFTHLQDGSTTGDAELADARIDYTGKTWPNVGDAIRGVTGQLYKESLGQFLLIGASNYEQYGIYDISDFQPNKIYGISNTITAEMISNLPFYGYYATLVTFKPDTTEDSTGYTRYDYISGGGTTKVYSAFSFSSGRISPWVDLSKQCIEPYLPINASNYERYGIHSITDFQSNKVYAISNDITAEMIGNLPIYGQNATLMTFKADVTEGSTGFTSYFHISPSRACIAFSPADGIINRWVNIGGDSTRTLTVGDNAEWGTIANAVAAAKDGDTILIYPGTYEEQLSFVGKTLHLQGICRESTIIIDKSGDYSTPPVEMSSGSISNLTIIETGEGTSSNPDYNKTAYCIHLDFSEMQDSEITIRNVSMINGCHACVGIGAFSGCNIIFDNCTMVMTEELSEQSQRGCFYAHTGSRSVAGVTSLTLKDCVIESGSDIAMTLLTVSSTNAKLETAFINTTVCTNDSVADSIIAGNNSDGTFDYSAYIIKGIKTHGNNVAKLN